MKKTIKITRRTLHPLLWRGLGRLFFLFFFVSCDKEIEIDYNSIDEIYVIEGNVTNESTWVYITTTRDMDDNRKDNTVNNAIVKLTSDDGYTETLPYEEDGFYRSANGLTGKAGTTYKLTVNAGDKEFSSESVMHEKLHIESVEFEKQKIININLMICSITFMDTPDEENFYLYRIYQNNELYSWSTFNDKGLDGKMIIKDLMFRMESGKYDDDDDDDIVYNGDNIEIELYVITKSVYDYFYSLGLSESASSNPIDNFEGGCLGYFSAHPVTRYSFIFDENLAVEN